MGLGHPILDTLDPNNLPFGYVSRFDEYEELSAEWGLLNMLYIRILPYFRKSLKILCPRLYMKVQKCRFLGYWGSNEKFVHFFLEKTVYSKIWAKIFRWNYLFSRYSDIFYQADIMLFPKNWFLGKKTTLWHLFVLK